MAKYVILREATAGLLEEAMNRYFEKGYELRDFAVDSKPIHLYVAVMQLKKPKRIPPLEAMTG